MRINPYTIFCFRLKSKDIWLTQLKMKSLTLHKVIFLGFIIILMSLGKVCANNVSFQPESFKNSTSIIHSFDVKNVLNTTPLIVENDLEDDDSLSFQQNDDSSDNTIQCFGLLFRFNSLLSKKVLFSHFLPYFPLKRYLLYCIFLI